MDFLSFPYKRKEIDHCSGSSCSHTDLKSNTDILEQKSSCDGTSSGNSKPENSTEIAESSRNSQEEDRLETNETLVNESCLNSDNKKTDVNALEIQTKKSKPSLDELIYFPRGHRIFFSFHGQNQNRRRQPFLTVINQINPGNSPNTPKLPAPPSYYAPPTIPRAPGKRRSPTNQEQTVETVPFFNYAEWAPYPSKIPSNVPPSLAQLNEVDVLFIIQKVDILELALDYDDLNIYIIQNKFGECIYFAYESSNSFYPTCNSSRNFQLHLLDLYQNEVIYMNKPWGCNFFLSFPVMEIYSPPMVPLGAIIKLFNPYREQFIVVDSNEKKLFKIVRNDPIRNFFKCFEVTYTIFDLSPQKLIVGYIRRNFTGFVRMAYTEADVYGISFSADMDAKMKAVLLGALFLVNLKRTGWVLRNVEDPETVSGHMYRMSIMTFLIPESSGVDKTRCMKLSLVHDLAECIVGDLTPYCGVDTTEKHRQEEVAMKELTQMIGVSGAEIYKLYKEYEAQVTDESKFVKDLDRLDMILQAFEYEKLGDKPGKLEEFFASTINKFHFPWTIDIVKEIYKQRNLHMNKGKSLGKDI